MAYESYNPAKALKRENMVIGEVYEFINHPDSNNWYEGSKWKLISFLENDSKRASFKLLSGGAHPISGEIGNTLQVRIDFYLDKNPKPYKHIPIKHAYFYHSVGD